VAPQICTTLYRNGIDYLEVLLSDLENWAKAHNHASLGQFRGKLGRVKENMPAFARVQYLKKTQTGE